MTLGPPSRFKHVAFPAAAIGVSLLIAAIATEGLSAAYVTWILHVGKIYRTDEVLGWSARPNLDTKRKRSDGILSVYVTDEDGFRIARGAGRVLARPWSENAKRRVLILGDSFAEGTVDVENRLDGLLGRTRPDWSVRSIGIGGYGTDQEMILGERFFPTLRAGDTFVLLTCGNDFTDLLMPKQFGRAKPWYSLAGDGLEFHPAPVGLKERLRDGSYFFGWLLQRFFDDSVYGFTSEDWRRGGEIYRRLVEKATTPLIARGVHVLIAHHTDWVAPGSEGAFVELAKLPGVRVVGMDKRLGRPETAPERFQSDLHWNERGYVLAADFLATEIELADGAP